MGRRRRGGGLARGGEAIGVGISVAVNEISTTTLAAIRDTGAGSSTITIDSTPGSGTSNGEDALEVAANKDDVIHAIAISAGVVAGGSGGAAVGATVAVNLIIDDPISGRESRVDATIEDATISVPYGPATVTATDHSRIQVDRRRTRARAEAGRRRYRDRNQHRCDQDGRPRGADRPDRL